MSDSLHSPPDANRPAARGLDGPSEPSGPRRRRPRWLLALVIGVLGVAGLAASWLPGEIALWWAAAARERLLDGDRDGALARIDRAIAWDDDNPLLYRQRAEWRWQAGDVAGAVADAEQAVRLAPDDPGSYVTRSQAYQYAGRWKDAVNDWNKIVAMLAPGRESPPPTALGDSQLLLVRTLFGRAVMNVLNARAYARALAGVELAEGLADVEEAIRHDGPNPAYLDTRGFLRLKLGDLDGALQDMSRAVSAIDRQLETWEREAQLRVREHGEDPREVALARNELEMAAAVLHYHRALAYDALGRSDRAERDRLAVRRLGFEPNERLF